jgi:hypothetical protein
MKKKTQLTLKEVYLPEQEEGPYDLGEFGKQPILTDYASLRDLYLAQRKEIYAVLKAGGRREPFVEAIFKAVQEAARYGYVTGHDTAMSEAEREFDKREDDYGDFG